MKYAIIVIIIGVAVATVYILGPGQQLLFNMKKINFTTTDSQKIVANLFPVEKPKGWLILTHMMPATKESWTEFAKEMRGLGYESLAFDLRGHGESQGGPDGYLKFTDDEHKASIQDLEAGWEFLKTRGALPEKTTAIGASIGANLSIWFLVRHPDIGGGVFLSPGNYRNIDMGAFVKRLDANQKVIFVASKNDDRAGGNNAETNRQYYDLASQVKNRHLILYDGVGHGTDFFGLKAEYNLTEAIKKFLEHGAIN